MHWGLRKYEYVVRKMDRRPYRRADVIPNPWGHAWMKPSPAEGKEANMGVTLMGMGTDLGGWGASAQRRIVLLSRSGEYENNHRDSYCISRTFVESEPVTLTSNVGTQLGASMKQRSRETSMSLSPTLRSIWTDAMPSHGGGVLRLARAGHCRVGDATASIRISS